MKAAAFLTAIQGSFERAAERAGLTQLDAMIAGVPIRFRVAGDALAARLFEGLHHRPLPEGGARGPAAVLSAFATETGGEVPPPPPWGPRDYRPRDEVAGFTAGRFRASYALTRSALWFQDTEGGRGVGWMRDLPGPGSRERAIPWWVALHWTLPANGRMLVHAASVDGVLLVGAGGAGKSTTTFASASAGLPCAGDDYVAIEESEGSWRAHALFRWARLDEASLARFPDARPVYRDEEKTGVELPNMVDSLPVRAVVVPSPGPRTGRPRPLARAAALRALAPSTLIQGPGGDADAIGALGRLVRSVPTLSLEVGPDLDSIPAAVTDAASAVAA